MKVRVCEHSPKGKNKFVKELQQQFPHYDVKVKKGCLKRCKLCKERPYAVLDDSTAISGETWEEVRRQIESTG